MSEDIARIGWLLRPPRQPGERDRFTESCFGMSPTLLVSPRPRTSMDDVDDALEGLADRIRRHARPLDDFGRRVLIENLASLFLD